MEKNNVALYYMFLISAFIIILFLLFAKPNTSLSATNIQETKQQTIKQTNNNSNSSNTETIAPSTKSDTSDIEIGESLSSSLKATDITKLPQLPRRQTINQNNNTKQINNNIDNNNTIKKTNTPIFADITRDSITQTKVTKTTTPPPNKDEKIHIIQTKKKVTTKKPVKYNDNIEKDIEDSILTECHLTPEINVGIEIPKHFNSSNNLKRKGGSAFIADGIPLFLYGRVTDEFCTPIANAVVQIWHRNHYGIYQYDDVYTNPLYDRFFLGSGTYITNNLGQFNFLTIHPGKYEKEPIGINVIVMHKDFIPIITKIFLHKKELQSIKESDIRIKKSKLIHLLAQKVAENTYKFNIALPGKYSLKE